MWGGFSETERLMLQALGWQDTIDAKRRVADVERLDRRLARARAKVERERAERERARLAGRDRVPAPVGSTA